MRISSGIWKPSTELLPRIELNFRNVFRFIWLLETVTGIFYMAEFLAYHKGWEGRTLLILTYYLGTIILFMGVTYFYSCYRIFGGHMEGSSPVTPLRSVVLCLVIRKTVTHKVLVVVRTLSPIDWYYYTAYNLAVNPGDDYVFAEREVYRNRLSNLVPEHGPTKVCHSTLGLVLLLYPSTA